MVPNPKKPISLGLNSKLVKANGGLEEKVWKKGGMYSASIEKIIENLELAKKYHLPVETVDGSQQERLRQQFSRQEKLHHAPVSYTHLTLPTKA